MARVNPFGVPAHVERMTALKSEIVLTTEVGYSGPESTSRVLVP
jgi:hypothetical protein